MKTSHLIEDTFERATQHYGKGEVIFCGVKYEGERGWIAKLKLSNETSFIENSFSSGHRAAEKLNNRMKKVIQRYQNV